MVIYSLWIKTSDVGTYCHDIPVLMEYQNCEMAFLVLFIGDCEPHYLFFFHSFLEPTIFYNFSYIFFQCSNYSLALFEISACFSSSFYLLLPSFAWFFSFPPPSYPCSIQFRLYFQQFLHSPFSPGKLLWLVPGSRLLWNYPTLALTSGFELPSFSPQVWFLFADWPDMFARESMGNLGVLHLCWSKSLTLHLSLHTQPLITCWFSLLWVVPRPRFLKVWCVWGLHTLCIGNLGDIW